ncbi:hypothetical protein CgunFtcFv8_026187 [Champsocephalus gunnari]|uniref:THD domain-containing protein n=1 Tax=Champsocephalus gunnari TaxID=52237 RepID=A0AAN8H6I0_CHAGU|nr:hypothetical protein CgunFtcFv8_026187 [Champsocephalus gunnari]
MGHTLTATRGSAEDADGDVGMNLGPDQSVLVLMEHCLEMKRQETRLRLFTLLLLLGCTALLVFGMWARVIQRGSKEEVINVEQSPAYSKQERCPPAGDPQTSFTRLHVSLRSYSNTSSPEGQVLTWDSEFEPASNVTPYIVIPEDGFYFVYLNFAIFCNPKGAKFRKFGAELHRSSEGYGVPERLMEVHDGLRCKSLQYRNVFVGQLLKLLKKDRLSVLIKEGFDLIHKATFGAYLV